MEVEQFKAHDFNNQEELRRTALQIYRAFLKSNSDFEVNVDGSTRKPIRREIDRYNSGCFDIAKDHIQKLMEPCYLTFITSQVYDLMREDLVGKPIPYSSEVREVAINHLVNYLDRTMPVSDIPAPETDITRRNNLLRAMIHAFCQTRLHLDFYDTPEGKNISMTPKQMLPPKEEPKPTTTSGDLSGLIRDIATYKGPSK